MKKSLSINDIQSTSTFNTVVSQNKNNVILLRTVAVTPSEEIQKLSNAFELKNNLGTPATVIFPIEGPLFSTISSVQTPEATKNKWGGRPNLVFIPSMLDISDRTATSLMLSQPATLHTCRSGDMVDTYNLLDKSIEEDLNTRFQKFYKLIANIWEDSAIRPNKHGKKIDKGMYGKYTNLPLHDEIQGKKLFETGAEFVDDLRGKLNIKGPKLLKEVVNGTKKDSAKELQDKVYASHENYVKFLKSTKSEGIAPYTVEAYNSYTAYLEKKPKGSLPYFKSIKDDVYKGMRNEIIANYTEFIKNGFRHNEFLGRLFPWEVRGVEIGHVDNTKSTDDLKTKITQAAKFIGKKVQDDRNKTENIVLQNSELKVVNAPASDSNEVRPSDEISSFTTGSFLQERQDLLIKFKEDKLNHPVIKEFIEARNAFLVSKSEPELSTEEKEVIFSKIVNQMSQELQIFSYQNGNLTKIQLPEDLTLEVPTPAKVYLDKELQKSFCIPTNSVQLAIVSSDLELDNEHILNARKAVELFLELDYNLTIPDNKQDSGLLTLSLLKDKYPDLSTKEVIQKNLNKLSLDSCMSVLSLVSDTNKIKYEKEPSTTTPINDKDLAFLDYDIASLTYSYSKIQASTITKERPLIDLRTTAYDQLFENLHDDIKEGLIEAYTLSKKAGTTFKTDLIEFKLQISNDYNIDVGAILELPTMAEVWKEIHALEVATFGNNHDNEISRGLFRTLGGEWSRSPVKQDEEDTFRAKFKEKDWLVNPFGDLRRQHKTGRGSLAPKMPSTAAIEMVKKEIAQGRKPFTRLEDRHAILGKKILLDNPSDRFAFEAFFRRQQTVSSASLTTTRMLNFWYEVLAKLPEDKRAQAPNLMVMEKLCEAYLCGVKHHHSKFEVEVAARSRENNSRVYSRALKM